MLIATTLAIVQTIDPRQLQINLTGFLEKNTTLFCKVRMQLHVCDFSCTSAASWSS